MAEGFLPPVVVEIVANITEFKAKMKEAQGELATLEAEGSARFTRLGKAAMLGGAAAGVAIAAGVAVAVKAYSEEQSASAKLEVALKNIGGASESVRAKMEEQAASMVKYGFTSAQATEALANMTTGTGSAEKAMSLMGVAADLAAYKHVNLSEAAVAVTRASEGNTRALKSLGIDLAVTSTNAAKLQKANDELSAAQEKLTALQDSGTASHKKLAAAQLAVDLAQQKVNQSAGAGQEIIAGLTKMIGGQADAASKTFAGTLANLRAATENLAAKIGQVLMPYVQALADKFKSLTDYLLTHQEVMLNVAKVIGVVLVAAVIAGTIALGAFTVAWIVNHAAMVSSSLILALIVGGLETGNKAFYAAAVAVGALTIALNYQSIVTKSTLIVGGLYTAGTWLLAAAQAAATPIAIAFGAAVELGIWPITLAVAAVAALAAGIWILSNHMSASENINARYGSSFTKMTTAQQNFAIAQANGAKSSYGFAGSMKAATTAAENGASGYDDMHRAIDRTTQSWMILMGLIGPSGQAIQYSVKSTGDALDHATVALGRHSDAIKRNEAYNLDWKIKQEQSKQAIGGTKDKIVELTAAMKDNLNSVMSAAKGMANLGMQLGGDLIVSFTQKVKAAGVITKDTASAFTDMANVIQQRVSAALGEATQKLNETKQQFDQFAQSISNGITSGNDLASAAQKQSDAIQKVVDATQKQVDAQKALDDARKAATGDVEQDKQVIDATKNLKDANDSLNDAKNQQKSFLDFLKVGADTATTFAGQVDALRQQTNSMALVQQVTQLGAQTGGRIISELLAGGSAAISRASELVDTITTVAQTMGNTAATQFYGAGVQAAQALIDGIKSQTAALQDQLDKIGAMLSKALGEKISVPNLAGSQSTSEVAAASTAVTSNVAQQISQITQGAGMMLGAMDPAIAHRMGIPGYAKGGYVSSTSPALMHAGEFVLSRDMLAGRASIPREVQRSMITNQSTTNQPITVNAVTNADPFLISREIAWAIRTGV